MPRAAARLVTLVTLAATSGLCGCYAGFDADVPGLSSATDAHGTASDGADGGEASGGTGDEPGGGVPDDAGEVSQRLWRLTARQYERTIEAGLGVEVSLPAIAFTQRSESFVNGAISVGVDEVFMATLETDVDALVADHFDAVVDQLGCTMDNLDAACLEPFLRAFTTRVQRTDQANLERYLALFDDVRSTTTSEDALRAVVTAALLSPKTLFRTELGDPSTPDATALSDFEIAESLAYSIWDGPPDDELLDLAAAGQLHDPDVVDAQVDRMFAAPEGTRGLHELIGQWLGLTGFAASQKTASMFPEYEGLKASMQWETSSFIDWVLEERNGDFAELLAGSQGFVDDDLAALYGLEAPAQPGLVTLPPERRGILTQASVLASMSSAGETAVIYRGKVTLARLLCVDLHLPADVVFPDFDDLPPDATQRERFEALEGTQPCGTCHAQLHPPAFALEAYDPIGRHRTEENGSAIDPSGSLRVGDVDIVFADAAEMFEQLAAEPAVHACFAQQAFEYVWGRPPGADDEAAIDAAAAAFEDHTDLRALYRDVVRHSIRSLRVKESTDACDTP